MQQAGKVENQGQTGLPFYWETWLQYLNSGENPGCDEYKTITKEYYDDLHIFQIAQSDLVLNGAQEK